MKCVMTVGSTWSLTYARATAHPPTHASHSKTSGYGEPKRSELVAVVAPTANRRELTSELVAVVAPTLKRRELTVK